MRICKFLLQFIFSWGIIDSLVCYICFEIYLPQTIVGRYFLHIKSLTIKARKALMFERLLLSQGLKFTSQSYFDFSSIGLNIVCVVQILKRLKDIQFTLQEHLNIIVCIFAVLKHFRIQNMIYRWSKYWSNTHLFWEYLLWLLNPN